MQLVLKICIFFFFSFTVVLHKQSGFLELFQFPYNCVCMFVSVSKYSVFQLVDIQFTTDATCGSLVGYDQ